MQRHSRLVATGTSHTREKTLMREVEQHFAKSLPYTNLHQKRLNAYGCMGFPRYGHVVHCNVCPPKACLSCLWALFGHSPAHRTVRRTRLREGLKSSIAFYHKVHTDPRQFCMCHLTCWQVSCWAPCLPGYLQPYHCLTSCTIAFLMHDSAELLPQSCC